MTTGDLVVHGGRVIPGPAVAAVENATVVVRDGVIAKVRAGAPTPAERAGETVDASGRTLVAGLWNVHVHFTGASVAGAARRSAGELTGALADLLTSRGFTTVADLSSDPRNTLPLRRRVESGEVAGPRILTATTALHPHRGLPYYTRETVPRYLWWALPQPRTPRAAARAVRRQLRQGADVIKLFTGSYVTRTTVKPMRTDIARAAVEVAHGAGVLVFAHASNREGLQVALDAGVDVIAHTPDETDGVGPLLARAAAAGVAMAPTFQMFARTVTADESYLGPIVAATRGFLADGGRLVFGTDVGYMDDPTIDDELRYLARCDLDGDAVLAMFTTTAASLFGEADQRGRVVPGLAGDLTLLDGDPRTDLQAFARAHATIRAGRLIWAA